MNGSNPYYKPWIIALLKANAPEKVLFLPTDFLPWEILLIKKLEIDKTKTSQYTAFKTDITIVVLIFSISNFLLTKTPRKGNCVREKKYVLTCVNLALF